MNKQIKSVSVIGDSLLKGIIYNENKNIYNVLENNCISLLEEESNLNINNYSICGLNIDNLNKYFKLVLNKSKDEIIILEIGSDSFEQDLLTNDFKPLYTIGKFNRILKKIIKTTKKDNRNIVFTTIPYISNSKFYRFVSGKKGVRNQKGILEINNFIEEINNLIKKLSRKYNVLLIDLNRGINSYDEDLYSIDGKYLSSKGHKILKNIFMENFNKSSIYLA